MKRRWLKLSLLFLAGAVINVTVAWRYSTHYEMPFKPLTSLGDGRSSSIEYMLFGVTLSERNLQTGSWESKAWSVQQEIEAGIPFRSMRGSRILQSGDIVNRSFLWEWTSNRDALRSLPCGILPIGWAANTLIYAAAMWLFVVSAGARLCRRRR